MPALLPSIGWALIGAVPAVALELYWRQTHAWNWWMLLLNVPLSYGIYRLLQEAPSLIGGIAVYSAVALALRVAGSTLLLREPMSPPQVVTVVLLVLAAGVRYGWR